MLSLTKKHSFLVYAFLISIFSYLLFFYPVLNNNIVIGGSDAKRIHYPSRFYLHTKLKEGQFPFWTEKMYSGFPIYADFERAYLNIVNIASVILFGPFLSYKVLHFSFYLVGSISLAVLLKRKNFDLYGYFATNIIYYFSFFHLYHQQHFSIILITYLMPLFLLLADNYVIYKKFKYLIYSSLFYVLGVYFGSLQSLILIFIAQYGYILLHLYKKNKLLLKQLSVQILLQFLLIVSLSLPQLVPTYNLFKLSNRSEQGISYTQGSYTPLMFVNGIYPFFFGIDTEYKGIMISDEYQVHETYFYVGLTSFILALVGFLLHKKSPLKTYFMGLFLVFMLFSFIGFIPLIKNISLPVVSSFRYWARSSLFFGFTVAYFAGYFITNLFKHYKSKSNFLITIVKTKSFKMLLLIPTFLLTLEILNLKNSKTNMFVKLVLAGVLNFDTYFFVWITLGFILVSLLIFTLLKPQSLQKHCSLIHLKLLFCALILFDLVFFGSVVVKSYLKNINEIIPPAQMQVLQNYKDKRIIFLSDVYSWNLGLYSNYWSIFGYSQLNNNNYNQYLLNQGFKNSKKLYVGDDLTYVTKEFLDSTSKSLGVTAIASEYEIRNVINPEKSNLIIETEGVKAKIIEKKEGHMVFKIEALENSNINTLIRNYEGWQLLVDGNSFDFTNNENDVYLSFDVLKGDHIVELKYVPTHFYSGLKYMTLGILIFIMGYIVAKQRNLIVLT